MGWRPMLCNGAVNTPLQQQSYYSVNMFLLQWLHMQWLKWGVVYMVRAKEL
jgi:hypothetical protein